MSKQSNEKLFEELVRSLPLAFLEDMAMAVPNMMSEAVALVSQSVLIEQSEIHYLLPHVRRAMFESQFRQRAKKAGLNAFLNSVQNDKAHYSVVEAGRFTLTASYVSTPGKYVRSAEFRSERGVLNELIDQGELFKTDDGEIQIPAEVIQKTDGIYCILLYGGELGAKVSPFMEFAFPAPNYGGYVDHYPFFDVLTAARRLNENSTNEPIAGAIPTLKPNAKSAGTPKEGTNEGGAG